MKMGEQKFGAVERERIMQEKIDEARRWAKAWKEKAREQWQFGRWLEEEYFHIVAEKKACSLDVYEARRWARRLYKENQELKRQLRRIDGYAAIHPAHPIDYKTSESWIADNGTLGESWQVDNE